MATSRGASQDYDQTAWMLKMISVFTGRTSVCRFGCALAHLFQPELDTTNKNTCVPSKDTDQLGHAPSLIQTGAFVVRFMGS